VSGKDNQGESVVVSLFKKGFVTATAKCGKKKMGGSRSEPKPINGKKKKLPGSWGPPHS